MKKTYQWYLLLLIPIIGMLVFNLYPLVQTLIDSFQNTKGDFIGLVNYKTIFSDTLFTRSVGNTLYMAVLGVVLNIPFAFIFANMLNNIPVGKNVYKIFFLLPMVMSMITVATLFKYLFLGDSKGVINSMLASLGLGPYGFFSDPSMSRETAVFMAVWKGVGYNVILFFAGLQVVPKELFEAARVDGANEFQQWIHITIPSIKRTFTFVLITSAIAALKRFTDVYAISGETGNPAESLTTLMLYIYRNSFSTINYKDLGRASSASIVMFCVIMGITVIQFCLTNGDNTATKASRRLKRRAVK